MGKDCKDCLPCKQGLPCDGGVRRITRFGSTAETDLVAWRMSDQKNWGRYSDLLLRSAYSENLPLQAEEELEKLSFQLKNGMICHRIYLNQAEKVLKQAGSVSALYEVTQEVSSMRRKALLMAGVSTIGGSYLMKNRPSQVVNVAAPAAIVFSGLYLLRTYGIL